ncbi:ethylbenzene dehydrogenase-related protein [Thauera aromatica]|uniref:ethylbenzene dehydrogenase-related protein n=1 Tax=Thauera aromatica TaxID=59405 RepID=UPI001FFD3E93|nr:ethylbenzene dehydrogenase-related protein [Thauera aromatica]MCK2096206.1 ethylbenzene dehydrogenase-related protein [Thauera aromatica]
MKKTAVFLGVSVIVAGCASVATGPQAIDWNKIPATKVALFYPGQSSYQWLRSEAHAGAAKETARGDACTSCHDDPKEEQRQGAKILRGDHPLEPHAAVLKGKNGHIDMTVQAAYDDKNAYLRFQYKTNNPNHPGNDYPGYRFDGKEWKAYGGMRLNKNVLAGKTGIVYENRVNIMLDDGKVPGFAQQGCWLTCHNGERDMQKEPTKAEVEANALMQAIKKSDVRKFIPGTRTNPMDWSTGKSLEEIAKMKANGEFLELMQWRSHRSDKVGGADDGFVLEYRNFDAGKNHFASNMDGKIKLPKFMFDPAKFGGKAFAASDYGGKKELILIQGVNAVPFDPNAGWKEGDILPQYVLSAAEATGSAADNKAISEWKDGVQTVVFIRPLGLTNADDKALKPGGVYNVGFAIHDDNMTGRGHHVSYAKTLGIGTKADITAVKLN